jgi:hypothetical protein
MTRRWLTAIGCVLGSPLLTMVVPKEDVLARAHDVLAAADMVPCTGYCVVCIGSGHAADVAPPGCETCENKDAAEGGGWHDNCLAASNCSNHSCNPESPSPEDERLSAADLFRHVSDAARRQDATALRLLVQENPRRVHYMARRTAVQITACDGDVIAHYPLLKRVAAALAQ